MKPISTLCSLLVSALVLFVSGHRVLADDQSSSTDVAVYAKVVLPAKPRHGGAHPVVESWIAKKLHKLGKSDLRAVTGWVRLAEKDEKHTEVWTANLEGNLWGCPVNGKIVEQTEGGKVRVELLGWSPAGAEVEGQTLASEVGSRGIAKVDTGQGDDSGIAYVALFVGPALAKKNLTEK